MVSCRAEGRAAEPAEKPAAISDHSAVSMSKRWMRRRGATIAFGRDGFGVRGNVVYLLGVAEILLASRADKSHAVGGERRSGPQN
jgi:hypothetical protein